MHVQTFRELQEWRCKFQLLEAESLLAQAKVGEADPLVNSSFPSASSALEMRRKIDQADALSKSGRADEAIRLLDQLQSPSNDPDLQTRLDVLEGGLLLRVGKPAEGERLLKRATATAERQHDFYQQASALLNLSYAMKFRYRYDEALDYGIRSLDISEKYGFARLAGAEHTNMGSFYRFLGDFDRAPQHNKKAIDLLTSIGDRGLLLVALGESGLLYMTLGQFEKAIADYEAAFKLSVEMHRNTDAARNADNLAISYIELNRWDKAEEWNEKSREYATPESGSILYETLNAARIAEGRKQTVEAERLYKKLIADPKINPALQWDAHTYLGQLYAEEHKNRESEREIRAALDTIDKTRSDLSRADSKITFLSRLISIHQEYVDLLVDHNDDAGAMRVIETSRARVLAERLGGDATTSTPITKLASKTGTVILSFWLAPKRSFAWLIDANGMRRFQLPPAREIEPLVTAYRNVVEHSLKDPIASGEASGPKLWNALLSDVAPHIPKGTRVVVIPDGPLHRLNLETLPVPSPKPHYWVEDVELAVAPSLSIATSKSDPSPQRSPSLLMIGAADYSGTDYKPLDKAKAEIQDIKSRFPGLPQTVHIGRDATPDVYRNSNPAQFSMIHFAAHADANNESPLDSAVVLSHHGDNYKLYARDVMAQPINADLVTISGCRSAGVRAYAGEGLIGFAWAFMQAGARAVVAGLWDVSDVSSEPLMNEFYGALAAGQPIPAAMHQAKLALIKEQPQYSKPFYWAPFQVYMRSIQQ